MVAGARGATDIARLLALERGHDERQDADGGGRVVVERKPGVAERARLLRPRPCRLHGGFEIDEARRCALGDQVVEPEVGGAEGLEERQPPAERGVEGVGLASAVRAQGPGFVHRLPGVAAARQQFGRRHPRRAEAARDVGHRRGNAQILGLERHGAALETQDGDRASAGMGVAEAGVDAFEPARVGAAEDFPHDKRAVGAGARGDALHVGDPVRGDAAYRESERRAAPEARPPAARAADAPLEKQRRAHDLAQARGEKIQRPLERFRPAREAGGPGAGDPRSGPAAKTGPALRVVGNALERLGEGLRPVGRRAGEAHIAQAAGPLLRREAERFGMGRERVFRAEGAGQRRAPPRQNRRVGGDGFERAAAGAFRRRRGALDDAGGEGVEARSGGHGTVGASGCGGPPRMNSPTVPSIAGSSPVARAKFAELPEPRPQGDKPSSVAAKYSV